MAIPEMVLQFEKDKSFVELKKLPIKFEKRYLLKRVCRMV
jgi:hypothetical protein